MFSALLLLSPQAVERPHPADPWQALQFLVGDWTAEGSGEPGRGSGGFSFHFELDGKILVRKNRSDYPATKDRPAFSHQDLMVIYQGAKTGEFRAIYFDNEGRAIQYAAKISAEGEVQFVSRAVPRSPRFRLTYRKTPDGALAGKFEISPPDKPEAFSDYLHWTSQRQASH